MTSSSAFPSFLLRDFDGIYTLEEGITYIIYHHNCGCVELRLFTRISLDTCVELRLFVLIQSPSSWNQLLTLAENLPSGLHLSV